MFTVGSNEVLDKIDAIFFYREINVKDLFSMMFSLDSAEPL